MTEFDATDGVYFDCEFPGSTAECLNFDQGNCEGEVLTVVSRSGLTTSNKCRACLDRLDAALRGVDERYPDSATPPSWFDPTYAGETWDEDY